MGAGTTAAAQAPTAATLYCFFSVLLGAVSEWCLIVILLTNAALSYAATRFASLCNLPPPCPFCSRLDHVLGGERRGFYHHLLCRAHKLEVSALVYCHAHRRLANSRSMCEACLLSSPAAAFRKPKPAITLGDDPPTLDGDDHPGVRSCSCCAEPFTLSRAIVHGKKKKSSAKIDVAGINNAPVGRRVQLRKRQWKSSDRPAAMPHVGYSELKITSGSETEIPYSDDDCYDENEEGGSPVNGVKDIEEESASAARAWRPTTTVEELVPERLIHPNPNPNLVEKKPTENDSNKVDPKNTAVESTERTIEQVPQRAAAASAANPSINDPPTSARAILLERNESFKNALAKKGMMMSPRISVLAEDLKLRLSQKSYHALDLPWSGDMIFSPRFAEVDASTSAGLQSIAKRLAVERNNSSLESYDACVVSDVEAETSTERLRQQIELDRKTMSALYKELEEERSASAVAANEALAMINRLQEEKAGMQMEALQCLRMMEEQAEYDQEAIHKLNDLLTDREKELMDLEAELESTRKRLAGEEGNPHSEAEFSDLVDGFDEEKAQISACLKNLQDKINTTSSSTDAAQIDLQLQDEVLKLNERLHALEEDKALLAHAVRALRYGGDGVRLVQEMARQLEELRRIPAT
ncbi:putative myosin-binding protein 5 [Curcuma longa]|uniref:putative myosin-binding protein 5 n=1 Tax=Curcuma longa TaxID=136217 RepID=UPI003D9E9443